VARRGRRFGARGGRALVRSARRADRAVPPAGGDGWRAAARAAALAGAPDAIAVPVLTAGGTAAMSWNGLSFTVAAEISGRRQAGTAMGIQNTSMWVVAVAVPVGLGALASGVSWQLAFVVIGAAPLAAVGCSPRSFGDEHERRAARRARLAQARA
jgi:hypothetical protein